MPDEMKVDVLAVAPHPDDLEIQCGGTLAQLAKLGHTVGMIHMTNGEPTPRGTLERRMAETAEAAKILGVAFHEVLDLPNRELMDTLENRYKLAATLRKYRPRVLMTMYGRTVTASPDHYQAQLLCEAARFYSRLTKWDDRFGGYPPHTIDHLVYIPIMVSAEPLQLQWKFAVDITDTMDQKLAAISAYKSQFDGERAESILHRIRSISGANGGVAGVKYAEIFGADRPVRATDPLSIL
jgi:bacillithiol biosynthesis deacetylase BshB1